ncbi:MAG: hypothetical protein IPM54_38335 [Polyangiaceae bacterium]|nr:hypothetical protein [Polyangiaceae bacterium]
MRRLFDLARPAPLLAYFADVRKRSRAPGVDGVTPEAYAQNLDARIERLSAKVLDGSWVPTRLLRLRRAKPGGGIRVLSIPTVEDRIVVEMLRAGLEPIIEPKLHPAAFAYRPGRSAHTAVDAVAKAIERGATWVAIADVRDFFDTVRIRPILETFEDLPCDPALVRLLDKVLAGHALQPGRGLAQGSSLSPLLSNVVMLPFDRNLHTAGFDLVRYCDNLCVPAASKELAEKALALMHRETGQLGLSLKVEVSRATPVEQGFLWLGFWLAAKGRRVSDGALQALASRANAAGQGIPGQLLRARLTPIVRGWTQYFDATIPAEFDFGPHDALIRELIAESSLGGVAISEAPKDAGSVVDTLVDLEMDDDPWSWETSGNAGEAEHVEPSSADALLRDADRLATAGQFEAAQEKWEAAQRLDETTAAMNDAPGPVEPVWDEERLEVFIGLFVRVKNRSTS